MKKPFNYGGQAVIEGVMMRGPRTWAVAVRCPDNTVEVETRAVETITTRYPFLKWPFVRGTVVLVESLVIGVRALSYSANKAAGEEEKPISPLEMALTIGLAFGLAILLFIVLPVFLAHLLTPLVAGRIGQNVIEGLLRVGAFVAYVAGVGLMPDIKRVFQYHGAEHKVINAYEAGSELSPEAVQRYSPLHPRCGTSFLLLVIVLKIFIFSFLATDPLWWRVSSRILLLPVVAGLAYELIKLTALYARFPLARLVLAPGLAVQRLTTREPDDSQVEVALTAFEAVRVREEGDRDVREIGPSGSEIRGTQ
ncbi:DUF1385 domain-containing protein [Candidatus Desulforudis audaxviator]|uniref:DUF1385 domain-containing protein n=1 Tax=Desulforudis audaxviator (strain MP104C) TaxID=477974 RepID=B1I6L3_DESAP|nr:DUF1385 domain-containing protein [Candidatus Desulforudis audaxviator]ACA60642.1 protein of unknown function DUF1385 [Candidatus Desulforudis audaxviator MP104C]AZK60725.1 hypothetical protein Daudx_2197 [Candidatus Desulforudis audaxviator]